MERKRTNEEIYQERMQAAEANERKYQQQAREMQQQQLETQQRMLNQQASSAQAAASQQSGQSQSCKEARKELEFVSSIRTISQDEKRMRTNAAITNVNAACGSNTQLMQEPQRVIVAPGRSHHPAQINNCNAGFCYDTSGNTYHRNGAFLTDQNGRNCQVIGTVVQCH